MQRRISGEGESRMSRMGSTRSVSSHALPPVSKALETRWKSSLDHPQRQQQFLEMLAKVPLFSQLSHSFLESVSKALRPVEYHPGQVVFNQGDQSDWLGVLIQGKLDCTVETGRKQMDWKTGVGGSDAEAPPLKIRQLKPVMPGNTVGEVNVLGLGRYRECTVTAEKISTLLVIGRSRWMDSFSTPRDFAFADHCKRLEEESKMDVDSFIGLDCFHRLGFEERFTRALFDHVERRVLCTGQKLMSEGGFGNEMYILEAGRLKVEINGKLVSTLTDRVAVGELAVLGADKRRRATVYCDSLCILTVIHGDVMQEVLASFPQCQKTLHHAYVKTLVAEGVNRSQEEKVKLDFFFGSVHPLSPAEMLEKKIGGKVFQQKNQRALSARQRPQTGRKWVPTKIPGSKPPTRPSTALDDYRPTSRGSSPCMWERRCHSAMD